MEDAHGGSARRYVDTRVCHVLILVLMEDAHGVPSGDAFNKIDNVLILVLMEDAHGGTVLSHTHD